MTQAPESLEVREITDAIGELKLSQKANGVCSEHRLLVNSQILQLRIGEQLLYKVDAISSSQGVTARSDAEYPRKAQKEFDVSIMRGFISGTWKGFSVQNICAVLLVIGFIVVSITYARSFTKEQAGKSIGTGVVTGK